jgi:hypothetical protein
VAKDTARRSRTRENAVHAGRSPLFLFVSDAPSLSLESSLTIIFFLVETQWSITTGKEPLVLSAQQVTDCAPPNDHGDHGCDGNDPVQAFKYSLGGVTTNATYPVTGDSGKCTFDPKTVEVAPVAYGYISQYKDDEKELMAYITRVGPVVASIHAEGVVQHYVGGILSAAACPDGQETDHAVVIVGYGTENGTDYWLIRNSVRTRKRNLCLSKISSSIRSFSLVGRGSLW